MPVFRSDKSEGNFTVMCNHHLRNKHLSLKATGLLCTMLSQPEDWHYTVRGLATICGEGKDSVESGLKELEREGYLIRKRRRLPNGRLGIVDYFIFERPDIAPVVINQPDSQNSEMADPSTVSLPQLNTKGSKEKRDKRGAHLYRVQIEDNIDYDSLVDRYGADEIDPLVELMLEAVVSENPFCMIAKEKLPREVVRSRILKNTMSTIEFVLNEFKNTTKESATQKRICLPLCSTLLSLWITIIDLRSIAMNTSADTMTTDRVIT